MKYRTIVNFFPSGVQVDYGKRKRFRHGDLVEQGGRNYVVERVSINGRQQTVNLYPV